MPKPVIVHHHVFKNAGSTIDDFVIRSFGADKVVLYDRIFNPGEKQLIRADELKGVLDQNPQCVAVGSHQLHVQDLEMDGYVTYDIALVRHPIDRLRSIHDFYNKSPQLKSPFAIAAQTQTLKEFMESMAAGQFQQAAESIQTTIFGAHFINRWTPPTRATLDEAIARLRRLPCPGVVERVDDTIANARKVLEPVFGAMAEEVRVINRTAKSGSSQEERLAELREAIGGQTYDRLAEMNTLDLQLWGAAQDELDRRLNAA